MDKTYIGKSSWMMSWFSPQNRPLMSVNLLLINWWAVELRYSSCSDFTQKGNRPSIVCQDIPGYGLHLRGWIFIEFLVTILIRVLHLSILWVWQASTEYVCTWESIKLNLKRRFTFHKVRRYSLRWLDLISCDSYLKLYRVWFLISTWRLHLLRVIVHIVGRSWL